jgi:hypothetical protein
VYYLLKIICLFLVDVMASADEESEDSEDNNNNYNEEEEVKELQDDDYYFYDDYDNEDVGAVDAEEKESVKELNFDMVVPPLEEQPR